MMLGRELAADDQRAARRAQRDRPATSASSFEGYGKAGYVAPFDLALRRGEVVGLAGLLGSGRTETRAAGVRPRARRQRQRAASTASRCACNRRATPSRHGFGYCPEERKTEGIVADLTVRENIVLALQARARLARPLSRAEQDEIAERFIRRWTSGRRTPERRSGCCPAATSRRCCWRAGSPPRRAC